MNIYLERYGDDPRVYSELDIDTESPEHVVFTVDDLSETPRMGSAIDRAQIREIRDELTAWLKRTA